MRAHEITQNEEVKREKNSHEVKEYFVMHFYKNCFKLRSRIKKTNTFTIIAPNFVREQLKNKPNNVGRIALERQAIQFNSGVVA